MGETVDATAYHTRPVRFLHLWCGRGWRMKLYAISAPGQQLREELVSVVQATADKLLPAVEAPRHHGVGWLIAHQGADGEYGFVDWWFGNDMVQHHPHGRPSGSHGPLEVNWVAGGGFCVWELAPCWFEREAWVDLVLRQGGPTPDNLNAYLGRTMNADV